MGLIIVQHYRGEKEHYNLSSHGQGIYFATDTKEIILNGESYSGIQEDVFIELQSQVKENTDALVVLNGTGDGSVVKMVSDAINEFALKVSDDDTVNTFKELVDYAAEHSSEIIQLVGEIQSVKEKDTEQDSRIEALEVLVGGTGGEGVNLIETVTHHSEVIQLLQESVQTLEESVSLHSSEILELKEKVGETSVASQIEEALSWENVE